MIDQSIDEFEEGLSSLSKAPAEFFPEKSLKLKSRAWPGRENVCRALKEEVCLQIAASTPLFYMHPVNWVKWAASKVTCYTSLQCIEALKKSLTVLWSARY